MKKILLFLLLVIVVSQLGCIDTKLTEKRDVLYINLALMGTYDNPKIDVQNTTAHVENLPLLKNPRYDKNVNLPLVYTNVFYRQQAISYTTSEPYNGPGKYTFTVAFKDGKPIPNSSDEFINVLIGIIDSDGTGLFKEYLAIRWPGVQSDED